MSVPGYTPGGVPSYIDVESKQLLIVKTEITHDTTHQLSVGECLLF